MNRLAGAPLTADEVAAALRPMDSPENVRRNLETVQRWACAGRLSAGNAGAAVRVGAEALKVIELGKS